MRDPKRIPRIIEKLQQVWEASPDMRLGQLVDNLKCKAGKAQSDIFYVEDDLIEQALEIVKDGNW